MLKFKYLKPSERFNIGGYANNIATRESAENLTIGTSFL
jgi:hypothetical protein